MIGARPSVPVPDHREVGRAVELRQRSRGEERHRLGERVIGHVQQRAEDRRLAAQTDPTAMIPTCSMLEYASSRFRFHWIRMNGIATSTDSRPSVSRRPPEKSGPSAAFEIRCTRSRQ